jgi:hypothetical protein
LLQTKHIPARKIAALVRNDSTGDRVFVGVAQALKPQGVAANDILRLPLSTEEDAAVAAAKILALNHIDGIVMLAPYKAAAKAVELIRARKPKMAFAVAVSQGGTEAFVDTLKKLGPQYADGVMFTQLVPLVDSDLPASIAFKQDLARYFPNIVPGPTAFEGYLTAKIFVEALKRTLPSLSTDGVINSLLSMRYLDIGTGSPVSFSEENHQASHKVWGLVLGPDGTKKTLDTN